MSVLDASVVLKWFVAENESDKAEMLRTEYYLGNRDIIVPDLILYEIANALTYHPEFSPPEINESIQTLFDMGIDIIAPTQMLIAKAAEIASENNVTCYDAVYLALAEELQINFITVDAKFYNKLISAGAKTIILLKNLKT